MADAVASRIVRIVFDRVRTMAINELPSSMLWGLESPMNIIGGVLADAEARQAKEKTIVDCLKKIKDVAYDIDDVLDEAKIEALKHTPDQFKSNEMVRKLISLPKSLLFRHKTARKKIKEITKRLDMISKEISRFHLTVESGFPLREEAIMVPRFSRKRNIVPIETGCYVEKSQVYGRDEDKKRIIDFLLNKCNEKNLGVISIVGLGGLGKTTLAQLVYNDDGQVSQHFGTNKAWVYVSEKFGIKNVIRSILESLTKEKFEPQSMELMEQELSEQIKDKRFLLVLDDVWNEDYRTWERLENLLKNGAKGSKVIVTTRNMLVASVMKSDELHSLGGLPDDDCWRLFESNAFESDDDSANNRNLVAIGEEIVKKCGGLPLAAKALGSVTRFGRQERQWQEVRDNEIWTQFRDNEDILPALMLSYSHLSPYLKQCFAYCSIFPKGTEVEIKMLVQLWVAEGFVDSSDESQYVDQLISTSLLQKAMKDGFVKMHDMVHNVAQFVAGEECSILDATSSSSINVPQNSRYASLILDEVTPSIAQILSSGHKLRTFLLICNRFYSHDEEDICQKVLDTVVSKMKLLRALHLSGLAIKQLPTTIEKLIHLRYLDLSRAMFKGLPSTVGLLHNLQALKLQHSDLETLPESIGDLVNLLTLDISYCKSFHSLPDTIGKLVHLQHLHLSSTKLQKLPTTIGTLKNLQRLDLSFCEKLEELPESIGGLANLLNLTLKGCWSFHSLPNTISELEHLQYLDLSWTNLQPLPPTIGTLHNLQTLILSNCEELKVLPESIAGLANLLTVDLNGCKSLYYLPYNICHLLRLQSLDLSWTKLQTLPPTIGTLRNLQTLRLSYCEELEMLLESIGDLANLLTLDLNSCECLHFLPNTIGKLVNLQYLDLSWTKLQTLPPTIGNLHNLQTLRLCNCEVLELLPESIGGLTNLLTLDLNSCKSLHSLPNTIGKLFHLQYLDLSWTKLQTLPPTISTLHNLQKLRFIAC